MSDACVLEQVENKNDISSGEVSSVDAGQIAGRYAESHGSRPPFSTAGWAETRL